MKNDELFNYIKQRLREGDDKEIIKNKLTSAGWQEKDIEEVFSIISNSSTELPSSPSFGQPTISPFSGEEKENKVFEKAGFGIRLIASLIDGIIIFLISLLIGIIVSSNKSALSVGEVAGYILYFPYVIGMWVLAGGATIGKKIMGIKIVTVDGSPIGLWRSILRLIGYTVSGLLLSLGYLWIIWDEKKQGFHDKIAGTIVVRS